MRERALALVMLSWTALGCGAGQTEGPPPPAPEQPPPPMVAQPAPAPAPEPPPAPKPTVAEMQQKYLASSAAAWAAHDAKPLAALYSEETIFGHPAQEGWRETPGRRSIERNMADFFKAFPDAQVTHLRGFQVGDVLAIEWVLTGTQQGDFMGQKPSGKKIGYRGASVLWFGDDGLVKREHMYFDQATFLSQLGIAPKGIQGRPVAEAPTGSKPEWVTASGAEPEKKNAELVTAFYGAWSKQDLKGFGDLLAEDAQHESFARPSDPPRGKLSGKAAAKRAAGEMYKAIPDLEWTTNNMWAAGNYVIVEGAMTGTLKGMMGYVRPTNKTGTVHMLDFVRVEDGKLAKLSSYGSGLEFASQFGLLKEAPPKAAAPSMPLQPVAPAKPAVPAKPAAPAKPGAGATPATPADPHAGHAMPGGPKPPTPAKPPAPARPPAPATPAPAKPPAPAAPAPAKPPAPTGP